MARKPAPFAARSARWRKSAKSVLRYLKYGDVASAAAVCGLLEMREDYYRNSGVRTVIHMPLQYKAPLIRLSREAHRSFSDIIVEFIRLAVINDFLSRVQILKNNGKLPGGQYYQTVVDISPRFYSQLQDYAFDYRLDKQPGLVTGYAIAYCLKHKPLNFWLDYFGSGKDWQLKFERAVAQVLSYYQGRELTKEKVVSE